jgi:hypothetical protein
MIAQKQFRKLRVEYRAQRDKEDEMRRLEKKHGKKKGREMAETQYKNFLEKHKQEEYEEVQKQEEMMNKKRQQ